MKTSLNRSHLNNQMISPHSIQIERTVQILSQVSSHMALRDSSFLNLSKPVQTCTDTPPPIKMDMSRSVVKQDSGSRTSFSLQSIPLSRLSQTGLIGDQMEWRCRAWKFMRIIFSSFLYENTDSTYVHFLLLLLFQGYKNSWVEQGRSVCVMQFCVTMRGISAGCRSTYIIMEVLFLTSIGFPGKLMSLASTIWEIMMVFCNEGST